MTNGFPKRRGTHLHNYDYSSTGVYFVTICIEERRQILSEIIKTSDSAVYDSASPTLHDVVCALKSLTSRKCRELFGVEKMFQRSSIEHIVRDREDYNARLKYIRENPMRWYYKKHP